MSDRYQDRAYSAGDYDRNGRARASDDAESDPLAELARLIGQTDPFASRPMSRANLPTQGQARPSEPEPGYDNYDEPEPYGAPPPAPPSWMQRSAAKHEAPPLPQQDDYPSDVHPLHRYAAQQPSAELDDDSLQLFADTPHESSDPSRYDEALYGSLGSDPYQAQHDQAYADEYTYDEDQRFDTEEPRKRGGMITVIAVLALAVFGVGGAYAYRTFTSSARSGEPPIIRADAGPTKVIPAPADGGTKVPDRMTTGDGTEKMISREETPIDPSRSTSASAPRVVFPPLTPNGTAPMPTSVIPPSVAPPATSAASGTFSNNDARKIKTVSVKSDQADASAPVAGASSAAAPGAKPASAPRAAAPGARTASSNPAGATGNAPLSLAPQADNPAASDPPVRMAATNPTQAVPSAPASAGGGNFLVQISSQRSEADAQASFKALQGKFPAVLGSRAPLIKRADLGDKGTYYRAMVGPFGSPDEASQFCGNLKSAGGQCVVQRN